METIKLARAHTLAGLAAMLLGTAAWSGTALAQVVSNPTTSAATANTNAANANADTNAAAANAAGRGQNNNSSSASSRAPTDPGVGVGSRSGRSVPGLNDVERQYFDVAKDVFQEVDAAADGLGPTSISIAALGAIPSPRSEAPVRPQIHK